MLTLPRPSFLERVALSLKRFRFTGGSGGNGYASGWGHPGWAGGLFGATPGTRYDYPRDVGPLWMNGVVLAAVNWFALTWNEAPLVVYRPRPGDQPEMLTEHPALDLLKNPNPFYDDTRLFGGALRSLLTAGNGYWAKEFDRGGYVRELYTIADHLIAPLFPPDGSDFITGYLYRPEGRNITLRPDQVAHLAWPVPHPMNERIGLSPLVAETKAVALDNEVSNYTATILRNMGIVGVALSPEGEVDITPEQAELIKTMFAERFAGDGRGSAFVSAIPMKIQTPGFSPEQMALGSIVDQPVPRICAALQIDPMVLGYASPNKTYSNMDAAIEAAYDQTLIPLHGIFDRQMTDQLMPDIRGAREGDYFGRDYTKVRCLQEDEDAKYKRLTAAVGGAWMTPNECREQVGLPPIEGGDELKQPMAPGAKPGEEEEKPPLPRAASLVIDDFKAQTGAIWRERAARHAMNGSGR